ncbi:RNA polymerase sigma-54 factor [Pseudochelatococcus lubricantis]|uniref:RNA polymerase sigma-54 factor n=1 Tax=Pseudochelatococcus lubricantis TaxID=1538102 RepID=A0ABX0UVK4_9HYPH|nr:RNA polymerase factor sigma-54 [Pseudochelatococcus lubricantis]NIJ56986.1 RNA polymerase sigma-54 factor [Pseudochelatococcus lubricantis]
MGLSHRLELRQSQSLVLTPQLLQAIRLLQLSHLELVSHIETELERNPLLERVDDASAPDETGRDETTRELAREELPDARDTSQDVTGDRPDEIDAASPGTPLDPDTSEADFAESDSTDLESLRDWSPEEPQLQRDSIEADFGTSFDNVFQDDGSQPRAEALAADEGLMVSSSPPLSGGSHNLDDAPDLEATLAAGISLYDHLAAQLDLATTDAQARLIGRFLIDAIDAAGYLVETTADIAARLGVDEARVEGVLALVQSFEPTGVGARSLAECLALQLRERDRYDPAMQALVANLALVARHDHAALRKVCGVDQEDLADMLAELRQLDPKPGRGFGNEPAQTLVPDVFVRRARDGGFVVELNEDTLPRVLLNRAYHVKLMQGTRSDADRAFLSECLQSGDWLTRSLEQRARTILKVASEIVRQQEGFFRHGAAHLRPLNLKTVADAIEMHESTISRVTANKAIGTDRGVFPMKYFFSAAVAAADGGDTHAAEAVRHRIRQLIGAETGPRDVLSDDALVRKLREEGIEVARRTVAKYRESLRIPSSVDRRRALAART